MINVNARKEHVNWVWITSAPEVLLTAEAALPCSQCNVIPDSSGFATSLEGHGSTAESRIRPFSHFSSSPRCDFCTVLSCLRLARIIKPAPRRCKTRAAWLIRLMQPTVFVGRPHSYLLCKAPGGLIKHKWFTLRGDVMAGGSHLLMAPLGLKPLPCSRAVPPLLTITCTIGAVCGSKGPAIQFSAVFSPEKIFESSLLMEIAWFEIPYFFQTPLCAHRARLLLEWQQVILWIHSLRSRHAHLGQGSAERRRQGETSCSRSTLTGLWSARSQSFMLCTVLQCCVHRRARDTGLARTQSPAWLWTGG